MQPTFPGWSRRRRVLPTAITCCAAALLPGTVLAVDCRTGAGTSISAGPPVAEGDVMQAAVTISVPHVGDVCTVLVQSLHVWLPNQPAQSFDVCEQSGGTDVPITGNVQLAPGEFIRVACVDSETPNCIDASDVNCELLADEMCYIVDADDAIAGSLLFAACWTGVVVGDGQQIQSGLQTSTALINPQISLWCNPAAEAPCSGQSSLVTINYQITTGDGDVAIANVQLVDTACGPPVRGTDVPGNNNDVLEIGEMWTYHCDATVGIPLASLAVVTGSAVVTGHDVSDSTVVLLMADCIADLDCDGVVGSSDLAVLLAQWGTCPASGVCLDDLWANASDGAVGPLELGGVLASWGPCP